MERHIKMSKAKATSRTALTALLLAAASLLCACSSGAGGAYGAYRSEAVQENETEQTRIVTPELPNESEPQRNIYASDVQTVRIVAAGDSMCHEAVARYAAACGGEGEYDFTPIYDDIADYIRLSDASIVNFEAVISESGDYDYFPKYIVPPTAIDALTGIGFNIIDLSNDHMLDGGVEGVLATESYIRKCGALPLAEYADRSDLENIRIADIDGIRVALVYFVGKTNVSNSDGSGIYVPYVNIQDMKTQMKIAKQKADAIIAVMHWGTENELDPGNSQRSLAAILAECGADVVIGYGPHVLQSIETLPRPDGGTTLVAYSLGNFMTGMYYAKNAVGGLLGFDLTVRSTENGPSISIDNISFLPTVCHYNSSRSAFRVMPLSDYTEELCNEHGGQKYGSFTLTELYGYVRRSIPDEYLPDAILYK